MNTRKLVISTDGAAVGVEVCELTALELLSVFTLLKTAVEQGTFPFPKPIESQVPSAEAKADELSSN